MAKCRKDVSSDRRDRLLGTYGYADGHVPSAGTPEHCEDDVWPMSSYGPASGDSWTGSSEPDQHNPNRAGHWARDGNRHVGGLSLAFEDGYGAADPTVSHGYHYVDSPSMRHVVVAASAPVNVPGWSKMVRSGSTDSMNCPVELDQDEAEWVPPHAYVAREHGKTLATSVFEGAGRTLKGRDMSRVRDEVLSRTGFFG